MLLAGYVAYRLTIQFDVLIICAPIRQIWRVKVFLCYRREQHQARMAMPVVLVLERIINELFQVLSEFAHSRGSGKGFVIAEKGKNHIRFGPRKPVVWAAELVTTHAQTQF